MKAAAPARSTCPKAGSGNQRPRQPISPSSRLLGQVSSFKLSTHRLSSKTTFQAILRLLKGRERIWHCLSCCCFAASPPAHPAVLSVRKTTANPADGLRSHLPEHTWRQTRKFWPDTWAHTCHTKRYVSATLMQTSNTSHDTVCYSSHRVALSVYLFTWVSQHPVRYSYRYAHLQMRELRHWEVKYLSKVAQPESGRAWTKTQATQFSSLCIKCPIRTLSDGSWEI